MFPFRRHKGICRPDALTERDIADICRTADQCNIEIIPFLQCLGHLQYVLHKPAYERYGAAHGRYMLCPSSEESLPLVRELIDEILTHHPGVRRLHIGGDEVDRGRGGECPRCDAYVKEHGFSALYVNHYTQVAEYCRSKGVIPLMWSDMMLQHPESLPNLPRDIAWVVWDYSTIANPTPALAHGASMDKLDQLSPAYRRYFGEGVGLADARQRGGLTAFGHAQGFKSLGFEAFTAPAARCSGDNFDLPRFDMHMRNIQTAFRQAAAFNLPGFILTSWSYRGSPHQVCLPEYACISYGWNAQTPDVDTLLSAFLRQRYGIDEPSLAPALLALTPIIPPSTRATPRRDDARDAWIVSADQQLEQITTAVRGGWDHWLTTCRSWLDRLNETATLWHRACTQSTRNQHELACWDLSMRHLAHRLELLDPAIRLAAVAFADATAGDDGINTWIGQLRAFDDPRKQLRQAWARQYRDTMTPLHLKVELYNRFDAEQEMIELLLADVARSQTKAQKK